MLMYLQMQNSGPHSSLDSAIDQGPYVNVTDGMVSAMCNEQNGDDMVEELPEKLQKFHDEKDKEIVSDVNQDRHLTGVKDDDALPDIAETSKKAASVQDAEHHDVISPVRRCLQLLSRQNRWSMWLLAYIAIMTSWPLVGSALQIFIRKKLRNVLPAALLRTNNVK
jgi:hypothetical protein